MEGHSLDKKDFFGKSDPFLVFYRAMEGNQWVPVHKTEVVMKTLGLVIVVALLTCTDPKWKPFAVNVGKLCNGDPERPIQVECYDWNKSGSHELIGTFKVRCDQQTILIV